MIHVFVITSAMAGILFFLFLVIQTLIWAQTNGDPTVTCVFRQNCTLPCNVDPSSDTIIHWDLKTSGGHNVHSYYDTKDQLGRQDQQFKGRTSLFQDLISRGNGSLRLTGVKIQDEGRYSCYSSTERGSRKTFIQLKVEALITEVSIKLIENRIICSSERIYPKPELSWSVNPPSELEINSPTMVHQTEEQLYSISSSLLVSDSFKDLTYSCTVSSSRNKKTASFHKRKAMDTPSKVTAMTIAIILGASHLFLLIWAVRYKGDCCAGTRKGRCSTVLHQQNSVESQHLHITAV